MEHNHNIDQINIAQLMMTYNTLTHDNKFKVRSMIRLLFEIQELRIKTHRLLERIRTKERTVVRLINQSASR
jgi:translation initiation factor IF-3